MEGQRKNNVLKTKLRNFNFIKPNGYIKRIEYSFEIKHEFTQNFNISIYTLYVLNNSWVIIIIILLFVYQVYLF